jgi:chromosome partitioning protein
MRTILVFSGKGGAGKTTLARELAVAGVLAGRSVAMVDMDAQAGLTGWFGRRQAEAPALVTMPPDHSLERFARGGVGDLVIDMPPGVPGYSGALVAQAKVVLVPVRPTPDDLVASVPIARSLAGHRAWAFVLMQAPPRSRLVDSTLRQLAALGRVAPVGLGFRQDFPAAAIEGLAAVEFPGTRSADEVQQLYTYLDRSLGVGDG